MGPESCSHLECHAIPEAKTIQMLEDPTCVQLATELKVACLAGFHLVMGCHGGYSPQQKWCVSNGKIRELHGMFFFLGTPMHMYLDLCIHKYIYMHLLV